MSVDSVFQPHYGTNQVIASGAASATANIAKDDKTVRIWNSGANVGYVRTCNQSDVAGNAASVADLPIGPGQVVYIEKGMDHDRLTHISALTTTLQVMTGEGGAGAGT